VILDHVIMCHKAPRQNADVSQLPPTTFSRCGNRINALWHQIAAVMMDVSSTFKNSCDRCGSQRRSQLVLLTHLSFAQHSVQCMSASSIFSTTTLLGGASKSLTCAAAVATLPDVAVKDDIRFLLPLRSGRCCRTFSQCSAAGC
jgi:hypothetical protein